jgi:hypothetical protein
MIRPEDLHKFLEGFCDKTEPGLDVPFLDNGIWATNGVMALRIDESLYPEFRSVSAFKTPEIHNAITKYEDYLHRMPFGFKELRGHFKKRKLWYIHVLQEDKSVQCSKCVGSGGCECSACGSSHPCGYCEGEGRVGPQEITSLSEMISDNPRQAPAFITEDIEVDLHLLRKLDRLMSMFPGQWEMSYAEPRTVLLFSRADRKVELYIMPMI